MNKVLPVILLLLLCSCREFDRSDDTNMELYKKALIDCISNVDSYRLQQRFNTSLDYCDAYAIVVSSYKDEK